MQKGRSITRRPDVHRKQQLRYVRTSIWDRPVYMDMVVGSLSASFCRALKFQNYFANDSAPFFEPRMRFWVDCSGGSGHAKSPQKSGTTRSAVTEVLTDARYSAHRRSCGRLFAPEISAPLNRHFSQERGEKPLLITAVYGMPSCGIVG